MAEGSQETDRDLRGDFLTIEEAEADGFTACEDLLPKPDRDCTVLRFGLAKIGDPNAKRKLLYRETMTHNGQSWVCGWKTKPLLPPTFWKYL